MNKPANIVIDQCGRKMEIPYHPSRIISLVPSQTELLYDLGLEKEVIGLTKFCIHPEKWFRNKTRIGGTKNPKIETIKALQPDLVIANKEENRKEDIDAITDFCPVWVSDIHNLNQSLDMIQSLGTITGKVLKAKNIIDEILAGFSELNPSISRRKVVYLIWKNPWISINQQTFIHDMLIRCGLENLLALQPGRYPKVEINTIKSLAPDYVFLSSEPFPFSEKHVEEWKKLLPDSKIMLVDGEMFSWYGSRLIKTAGYLQKLINQI